MESMNKFWRKSYQESLKYRTSSQENMIGSESYKNRSWSSQLHTFMYVSQSSPNCEWGEVEKTINRLTMKCPICKFQDVMSVIRAVCEPVLKWAVNFNNFMNNFKNYYVLFDFFLVVFNFKFTMNNCANEITSLAEYFWQLGYLVENFLQYFEINQLIPWILQNNNRAHWFLFLAFFPKLIWPPNCMVIYFTNPWHMLYCFEK